MEDLQNVGPGSEIFLDSEEDYEESVGCPWCGGREFQFLGVLGNREWLRCRGCGSDSPSTEIDPNCEV